MLRIYRRSIDESGQIESRNFKLVILQKLEQWNQNNFTSIQLLQNLKSITTEPYYNQSTICKLWEAKMYKNGKKKLESQSLPRFFAAFLNIKIHSKLLNWRAAISSFIINAKFLWNKNKLTYICAVLIWCKLISLAQITPESNHTHTNREWKRMKRKELFVS